MIHLDIFVQFIYTFYELHFYDENIFKIIFNATKHILKCLSNI
jgi:hypothetical protein